MQLVLAVQSMRQQRRVFHAAHLRQEHLARAEEVAHDVHAGHEGSFDHVQGSFALFIEHEPALLHILLDGAEKTRRKSNRACFKMLTAGEQTIVVVVIGVVVIAVAIIAVVIHAKGSL